MGIVSSICLWGYYLLGVILLLRGLGLSELPNLAGTSKASSYRLPPVYCLCLLILFKIITSLAHFAYIAPLEDSVSVSVVWWYMVIVLLAPIKL